MRSARLAYRPEVQRERVAASGRVRVGIVGGGMVTRPLLRSTLVGIGAGLSAAWIMNQFQSLVSRIFEDGFSDDDERKDTTVRTADMLSKVASGEPVPEKYQGAAGSAVHYGFWGFLGALYGAAGAFMPGVRSGFGTAYGAGAALVADETMVPALGLAPPPQDVPLRTHAYGITSHLVFGAAMEGARRLIEQAIPTAREPISKGKVHDPS